MAGSSFLQKELDKKVYACDAMSLGTVVYCFFCGEETNIEDYMNSDVHGAHYGVAPDTDVWQWRKNKKPKVATPYGWCLQRQVRSASYEHFI